MSSSDTRPKTQEMDSPDSTGPQDEWPKKPIEIRPNDLADLLEEIWGIEKTKPRIPSKSSTSSSKKVIIPSPA